MLKFPLEDQTRYSGKILFQKYASVPVDLTKTEGVVSTIAGAGADAAIFTAKALVSAIGLTDRPPVKELDTSAQQGPSAEPTSKRIDVDAKLPGACIMYLPQSIQISDGVNLNETSLGIFGSLAERSLQGGASIAGALAQALGEGGRSLADVVAGGVDQDIFAIAAGRLTQVQPITNAAIRSATAVTPNPNLRVIFEGVNLRRFGLVFEMMPKSPQETQMAKDVIKYFRSGMIPESIRAGGISAGFRTPSRFEIKLKHGNTPLATKFKKCFLSKVNVSYNGQNMAFLPDGNFQRYEIGLEFVEEQTIDKQDVEAGF